MVGGGLRNVPPLATKDVKEPLVAFFDMIDLGLCDDLWALFLYHISLFDRSSMHLTFDRDVKVLDLPW